MHRTTPSDDQTEVIRRHLVERHGQTEVDPARDVSCPGHPAGDALVVFFPERPGTSPSFVCARCEGRIFPAGPPSYGHPLRAAHLVRTSPVVAALGCGLDHDQRLALIGAYERGLLGTELLALTARAQALRTRKSDRPVVEERRQTCQRYLIDEVSRGASVDDALWTLVLHAADDPVRYGQFVGGTYRPLSRDAYRGYWRALAAHVRTTAIERSRALRQAAERCGPQATPRALRDAR